MKKIVLTLVCVICCTLWGYGQSALRDKVAILKVEDMDGVLDRSGEIMLQSAMMDAFSRLQNLDIVDCSMFTRKQKEYSPSEIKTIGDRVLADIVIIPSVVKLNGSEIYLSAKIVYVRTRVTDAGGNIKCDLRAKGMTQATVFKQGCENLAKNLSNKIFNNQMKTIIFSKGELYRNGIELSESEIKSFFEGDGSYGRYSSYERWKRAKEELVSGPKWMAAASVVTSLGISIAAAGIYGLVETKGWPDDDIYRALSIGGTIVGAVTGVLIGPICFIGAQSKKAGWEKMENIFLERQSQLSRSRAELNFGAQKYGVGFAIKF